MLLDTVTIKDLGVKNRHNPNEMWPEVIEKAFAKIFNGYAG